MCRQLKTKLDSDIIVDTLFFGTFAKMQGLYMYCPGPKAVIKLIENEANVAALPQLLLDEKLISISGNELSESTGLTVEQVTGILSTIRDEIVDQVVNKKSNVCINFGFGHLVMNKGTMEFKPS